jgi:hypothetical protein
MGKFVDLGSLLLAGQRRILYNCQAQWLGVEYTEAVPKRKTKNGCISTRLF